MRLLKLAIISIILLFLLITGVSLLIPSHIIVSRAINIKTVNDSVWNKLDDFHKWEQWNPFFNNLAAKKVAYSDSGNGQFNTFKVETTTINWIRKTPSEHVVEMLSPGRKPLESGWKCITYPNNDSLTLQWYMRFKLHWYPWEKFASLMFERSYGLQMEQGLNNLKAQLER